MEFVRRVNRPPASKGCVPRRFLRGTPGTSEYGSDPYNLPSESFGGLGGSAGGREWNVAARTNRVGVLNGR